jgi:hypothetical protein
MKKLLFVSLFMSLCALLSLVGCAGGVSRIETEPTRVLATPSPTQVSILPSPTETASTTMTPTAEVELVNTPTSEPSVTATAIPRTPTATMPVLLEANTASTPVVCNQFKSYINIQQETNNVSRRLMDYVFENEDAITFLMWSSRPYPGGTPTPFAGTIEPGGVPPGGFSRSHRRLLKGLTWDFNSRTLVESPVTEHDAIQSPCETDCPLEVVGVAPDNSWQLLQVTEAPAEYQGLWLVNEETIYNLVPYVPSNSQWQWSNDSQLLWLVYTLQDNSGESYAFESMVVDLTAPASPQIIFQSYDPNEWQSPHVLSPNKYKLVFSPEDKTVLSYEAVSSSEPNPPNNQLEVYRLDVSQNPPQLLDTYKAQYPFLIDWSDTLQDFVVLELNATGVLIYALNHDMVYEIPMEVIKQMPRLVGVDGQTRTDFNTEVDIMILSTILERVALSPTFQHVVLMDQARAWAFSCSD